LAGRSSKSSLDNAAFAGCASPKSYSSLPDGSHAFKVRATDTAGNVDTTAPAVEAVAPQDGATGVPLAESIGATFSESMDPSTISGTTVPLTQQGASQPVTAQVSYDCTTNRAIDHRASDYHSSQRGVSRAGACSSLGPRLFFMPLFTGVRGLEILRSW
jgi:hypothetical protein